MLSSNDSGDLGLSYSKNASQIALGVYARLVQLTYTLHIVSAQSRFRVEFALRRMLDVVSIRGGVSVPSPLVNAVACVVGMRTKEQVVRITACPVVTAMAHKQSGRNGSVGEFVRKPVRRRLLTTVCSASVPGHLTAGPFKTSVGSWLKTLKEGVFGNYCWHGFNCTNLEG